MSRPKPWAALTPADKLDAIRPLLAQGLAPSTMAFKLGGKQTEIARLASQIRREEFAGSEEPSDVATVEATRIQIDPPSLAPKLEAGDEPAAGTGDDIQAVDSPAAAAAEETGEVASPAVPTPQSFDEVVSKYAGMLPDWTKIPRYDRDQLLAHYCQKGLTASAIANNFLNCSRSAVIGLVHRLQLKFNNGVARKGKVGRRKAAGEPATARPPRPPATRRATKLVQQTSSWRGANNPPASDFKARAEQRAASPGLPAHLVTGEPRRPVENLSAPVSRNLKLVELTEQTCKWPIGDPQAEDFGFCGNQSAAISPYCRYHARISYQPPSIRQRAGIRSAERIS